MINMSGADSHWKYDLGKGWSKVHVEIKGDSCHIQLLKQSFWKRIGNIFLRVFHREEFKSKINEKVFSYLKDPNKLQDKICKLSEKIKTFEDQKIHPYQILKMLVKDEKIDKKKSIQTQIVPEKNSDPNITYTPEIEQAVIVSSSLREEHVSESKETEDIVENFQSLAFLEEKDEIDHFFDSIKNKKGLYDLEKQIYLDMLACRKLEDNNADKIISYWVDEVISLSSGTSNLVDTAEEQLEKILELGKNLDFQNLFSVLVVGYRLACLHVQEEVIINQEDLVSLFEHHLYNLIDLHYDKFDKKLLETNGFSITNPSFAFDKNKASKVSLFMSGSRKIYQRDLAARRISTFINYAGHGLLTFTGLFTVLNVARPLYQGFSHLWENSSAPSKEPKV